MLEKTQEFAQHLNDSGQQRNTYERTLSFLIDHTSAFQASLYLLQGGKLVLKSCFHQQEEVYSVKQFYLQGKGMIGRVAEDQEAQQYDNVPQSFFSDFKAALKEQFPSSVYLAPLMSRQQLLGVVQVASERSFTESEQYFIQQIAQLASVRIFMERQLESGSGEGEQVSELYRKNKLLSEAKKNAESTNQQLRQQVRGLEEKEQLMLALLNKVNEAVLVFSEDMELEQASGATKRILGISPLSVSLSRQLPAHLVELEQAIREQIRHLPQKQDASLQKEVLVPNERGELVWLHLNVGHIDLNGAKFYLVAIKDVSGKKQESQSLQVPGQMQALAENTPDAVLRISQEKKLLYVNPAFEELVGIERNQLIDRPFSELRIEKRILKNWESQIDHVLEQKQPFHSTTSISNYGGERFLQIGLLPEFNSSGQLVSMLLVLRDNTENKRTKVAIRNQSEKLRYGETYAKTLQQIVIPTRSVVQHTFPDSFILSKPKNIIPGDFPWCYRSGKHIYLGAIDTKEVGVAGALNTLNLYYLLVQIMDNWSGEQLPAPSEIMIALHNVLRKKFAGKMKSLSSKTGIDIALARIQTEDRQLLYSGANIPMYLMNDGRVEIIKGTSYSLGIQRELKNDTFRDVSRELTEKDVVLLASDGLQNTFGGERFKRFSAERIRDLLYENGSEPMFGLSDIYEQRLAEWLNGKSQIDDILLLGARLSILNQEAEATVATPDGAVEVGGQELDMTTPASSSIAAIQLTEVARKNMPSIDEGTLVASHEGIYNQATIKDVTAKTEAYLEQRNESRGFAKKVFNVMVEMLQNISRHAYNPEDGYTSERFGFFAMVDHDDRYEIITANFIQAPIARKVNNVMEDLQQRSSEELKQRYKELMKKSRINEEGGAGLGFVDIARKTDQNMYTHFEAIDEHFSVFVFRSAITKKK